MSKFNWSYVNIQALIGNAQESLILEFKRIDALQRADGKIAEISRDVSSFANATGGTIIYGMVADKDGYATSLQTIINSDINIDWLDNIISGNIRPPIRGIRIVAISDPKNKAMLIYVVDIPAGTTAHQASDGRYYKRTERKRDFMHDYEIRDVMFRAKYPIMALRLSLHGVGAGSSQSFSTQAIVTNTGNVRSIHTKFSIEVPEGYSGSVTKVHSTRYLNNENGVILRRRMNLVSDDVVFPEDEWNVFDGNRYFLSLRIPDEHKEDVLSGLRSALVTWTVYADDAPPSHGERELLELLCSHLR